MKGYLEHLLEDISDPIIGRNLVREYLQARILESLQRAGAMAPLAFQGGTALRFLFSLPRYSEDLDFSLENPKAEYDFRAYLKAIQIDLSKESYQVRIRFNDRKVVHSAFVSFDHLLYSLGLSPQRDEALAVKIEVDTHPPIGAGLETTLVRRHVTLRLQHHDRASLLAGKLHAILQRRYAKGRDLYDLMWYLSDPEWPGPNLLLLNNALLQSGWNRLSCTPENWRQVICQRLKDIDLKQSVNELRPFLERPVELSLLTRENFDQLLSCTTS